MERFAFDVVASTNEVARRLVAEGRVTGRAYVIAREQTGGRGTRGRTWSSPRDAGIYLSLVEVFDDADVRPTALFSLAAGVAGAEAIETTFGVAVQLKPVNDLYAAGGKLGGILCETTVEDGRLTALVTGVGINLLPAERPVPPGAPTPIWLAALLPPDADRSALAERLSPSLLDRLVAWLRVARDGDEDAVRAAWERRCVPGSAWPST